MGFLKDNWNGKLRGKMEARAILDKSVRSPLSKEGPLTPCFMRGFGLALLTPCNLHPSSILQYKQRPGAGRRKTTSYHQCSVRRESYFFPKARWRADCSKMEGSN